MRKKLGIALGILAALAAILAATVAVQPAEFRIERSTAIAAPPETVFGLVDDFHHWNVWSPWAKMDPAMAVTCEGAEAGTGAVYTWAGNSQVGEGRMTITESNPNTLVRIRLEFIKPFTATNTAEFAFAPEGDKTSVTWSMSGTNNFMGKAFGLFVNIDDMVGGDFEHGLAALKSVAETPPEP